MTVVGMHEDAAAAGSARAHDTSAETVADGSTASATSRTGTPLADPATSAAAPCAADDTAPTVTRRHTVLGDLRDIVRDLAQSRDLLQQLTLRDIRIRYKQAALGFAWALLMPMVIVLAGLAIRAAIAYAAGAHLSTHQIGAMAVKAVPWAFFVGCINMGTPSLIANIQLVTKIYFPREVLPLAAVLAQSFDSSIGALLVPAAVVLAGMAVRAAMAYASGRHLGAGQLAGMAVKAVPWAFFVGCLNAGTASLVSNTSLVTKIYFPREVLPLASVLAQTFDSLIGLALISLMLPFLGVSPSWQLLWVPLLLGLLWTFALAAALFLGRANLFFRDVKYMVQVFLTFGIFVTPVILDAPMYGPRGGPIIMLNPIAPLLEGLRLSVVAHHNLLEPLAAPTGLPFWQPWHLAYAATWAIGGLFVSLILFHRSERHFAEVV